MENRKGELDNPDNKPRNRKEKMWPTFRSGLETSGRKEQKGCMYSKILTEKQQISVLTFLILIQFKN